MRKGERNQWMRPEWERAEVVESLRGVKDMGRDALKSYCTARLQEPMSRDPWTRDWQEERLADLLITLGPACTRVLLEQARGRLGEKAA